jgi:lactate permease
LQHSGAAIGNAICLFNIIAAGSVAGIKDENKILKLVIKPSLVAGLIIGLCGFILLSFF